MIAIAVIAIQTQASKACTGITLKAKDGSYIVSRTIEWGGSYLDSRYVIVPRGHRQQSLVPGGTDGMRFTARYGYVGLSVEMEQFVVEGINEAGLSAGLFYFPGYGKYADYDSSRNSSTVSDFQLVSLILGSCQNVEEVREMVGQVTVVAIDPRSSTVHWRFADAEGRQIVLEIIDGKPVFYENQLGVLTNSPGFEWQMTNLNNYVNLRSGAAPAQSFGDVTLSPFGAGSATLGIPGDVTPPSRFVRAAFYKATAPQYDTSEETVMETFQILNNFDIPIGVEHKAGEAPSVLPSATQWTTSSDLSAMRFYYRTAWNSTIRCIDLKSIDFSKVSRQSHPLDEVRSQPVEMIRIRK